MRRPQFLPEAWTPVLCKSVGQGREGMTTAVHDPARLSRFLNKDKQGEDSPTLPRLQPVPMQTQSMSDSQRKPG